MSASRVALSVLCITGCVARVDIPDPPNLDAIAAKYDRPDGVLTPANVQSTVGRLTTDAQLVARANPMATFSTLMDSMKDAMGKQGISTKEEGDPEAAIQVNAVAQAHLVCPGWAMSTAPDPAINGTIDLETVVRSNRLSRVVWGDAVGCRAQGLPAASSPLVPATFNGGVRIHRFDTITTPFDRGHYLIQILGSLDVEDSKLGAGDFRLSPGLIEVRFALADGSGDVIGSVGTDTTLVRARNGDFTCRIAARRCDAANGDTMSW